MEYSPTVYVNDSAPGINAENLNKSEQGIYSNSLAIIDNEYLLKYKQDVIYGGNLSDSSITLTKGKSYNYTNGKIANNNARAISDRIIKVPDLNSVYCQSGYKLMVLANDDGIGNPMTMVSSWVTEYVLENINYKYIYIVLKRTDEGDITGDVLTNAVKLKKYTSTIPMATKNELDETFSSLHKVENLSFTSTQTNYKTLSLFKASADSVIIVKSKTTPSQYTQIVLTDYDGGTSIPAFVKTDLVYSFKIDNTTTVEARCVNSTPGNITLVPDIYILSGKEYEEFLKDLYRINKLKFDIGISDVYEEINGYYNTSNLKMSDFLCNGINSFVGYVLKIEVAPNEVYTINNQTAGASARGINIFNKEGTLIKSYIGDGATDVMPLNNKIIMPAGAKYAVFASYSTLLSVVRENNTISEIEELKTKVAALETGGNVLYEKKWYCCGDSFSHGDYTGSTSDYTFDSGKYAGLNKVYSRFIALRNNMDLRLLAANGATLGMKNTDTQYSNPDYDPEEDAPSDTNNFFWTQINNIDEDENFKGYITLWFGINDASTCDLGSLTDETVKTFYGALNWSLHQLLVRFPLAHIGIVCSYNLISTYQTAVKEVAQRWAVPYLDIEYNPYIPSVTGRRIGQSVNVDSRLREIRWENVFRVSSTNLHPNEKAHEFESLYFENWLRTI